jgi:hypothetical protein
LDAAGEDRTPKNQEFRTSVNPLSERVMIEALLMHPISKSLYRCRVHATRDGLLLARVSGEAEAEIEEGATTVESEPTGIPWRLLRGFSADESYVTPAGRRLQVLEIDTDEGVLTVLAAASEVSVLFSGVARWVSHWRLARSPLGVVFAGRRRKSVRQVA